MAYMYFNNNPLQKHLGDCVVRAVSCAMNKSWDETYLNLADEGYRLADLPSSNAVWSTYLRKNGFKKHQLPDNEFFTVKDFAASHPINLYILATGNHLVTVRDGNYYDAWDSGDEVPESYWTKDTRY